MENKIRDDKEYFVSFIAYLKTVIDNQHKNSLHLSIENVKLLTTIREMQEGCNLLNKIVIFTLPLLFGICFIFCMLLYNN